MPTNRSTALLLTLACALGGGMAAQPATAQDKTALVKKGDSFANSIGMTLKLIPAGEFQMGSNDADVQAYLRADKEFKAEFAADEQPQHRVKITKPFYMGVHEVTQAQYQQVMGTNPSEFASKGGKRERVSGKNTDRFPVEFVSWFDAVEFCIKVSQKETRSPCYRLKNVKRDGINKSINSADVEFLSGDGYRLPTEAEWEYACRAGTTTPFHFGGVNDESKSNIGGNLNGTTAPGPFLERTTTVGSYPPNAFGLYDMHGNVWEWCQDYYDQKYYNQRPANDPQGASSGKNRVSRGGSWGDKGMNTRAASRYGDTPDVVGENVGFRVVTAGVRTP